MSRAVVNDALRHAVLVCAVVCATTPRVAWAECALEGVTAVRDVRPDGSDSRVSLRQRMRVVLRGAEARVEGVSPLAFRGTAASADVELFLGAPRVLHGVVGVPRGTPVTVQRVIGDVAVVRVREDGGYDGSVSVEGLRVACSDLTTEGGDRGVAPTPEQRPREGWIPSTTAHFVQRCTTRRNGLGLCVSVHTNRCAPVGDGSVCGYRARPAGLTLFAAPSERARSARVEASRELVLADEDARAGWLLLRARMSSGSTLEVRGWVRRSEVVWRQEAPRMQLGRIGTIEGRPVRGSGPPRVGWVQVRAGSELSDRGAHRWARTVGAYCAEAVQEAPGADVWAQLPGALAASGTEISEGLVAQERVQWVPSCAR